MTKDELMILGASIDEQGPAGALPCNLSDECLKMVIREIVAAEADDISQADKGPPGMLMLILTLMRADNDGNGAGPQLTHDLRKNHWFYQMCVLREVALRFAGIKETPPYGVGHFFTDTDDPH